MSWVRKRDHGGFGNNSGKEKTPGWKRSRRTVAKIITRSPVKRGKDQKRETEHILKSRGEEGDC